jgi:DNA-binding NtrC family response regulator/Tfp pilus assembly protein PilF
VLRWLPPAGRGELRRALRHDILDLACLEHASLALPSSFGLDPASGRAFLLRPFVPGSDIISALRGRGPRAIVPWLAAAAEALAILHRFGLAHGAVKASNLIVPAGALSCRAVKEPRVVLCDPALRPVGHTSGEPAASFSSDLRALGEVYYWLLTGTGIEVRTGGYLEPPSERNPDVPIDLDRIVLELLGPEPGRRYRDAGDLVEDLERLAGSRSRPSRSPPDCFLDRSDELSAAARLLGAAERPCAIAVAGEAGIGKTAFLQRFALEAELAGLETTMVRCRSGGAAPFGPLRDLAASWIPAGPAGRALRGRLRRILGEADGAPRPASHASAPGPTGRRRLVREMLDLFLGPVERRPALIIVDDAHLADSLTLELLSDLVREIADRTDERTPPSIALAYRAESPYRAGLVPLIDALARPGESILQLELGPLPAETVEEWIDRSLPGRFGAEEKPGIAARLGGNPHAVHESLRAAAGLAPGTPLARDLSSLHERYAASLGRDEREALDALALIGRPAPASLLVSVLAVPAQALRRRLVQLVRDGAVEEEGGRLVVRHGSFQAWAGDSVPAKRRRSLHRRIARSLERAGSASDEEVARHWLLSGAPGRGFATALRAARRLAASHEDRRALAFYRAALEILPGGKRRLRCDVAAEAAEAHARAGEQRKAIEMLEELLKDAAGREADLIHARLGVFLHRSGENARAVVHLEKALRLLEASRAGARLPDILRVESELAEIASNKGEHERAESICRRALERLGAVPASKRSLETRREEMVLLETLAHLRLRCFRYREALHLFERSLEVGRKLDLVPEKSLLLNNLGTLHVQENRLHEAIDCYERARKLSARLGDDQSLATILSNLAALHAKTGDPDRADEAIRRAQAHEARCDSRRTRFIRLHNAGLVDLTLGRHSSAIEAFEEAVVLGDELKDSVLAAFDLVYLGECRLFRGEAKAADACFERALERRPSPPAPIAPMVESRRAALAALRGDMKGARERLASMRESPLSGVAYLDAWNRVFLGWARRLSGDREGAAASLEAARAFFHRVKAPGGEIHATLELAALETDAGRPEKAAKRFAALRERFRPGEGPLRNPLLCARLLLYETRAFLEAGDGDPEPAAHRLVEAEGHLIGRRSGDLEALARDLRGRLRLASLRSGRGGGLLACAPRDPAGIIEMAESLRGAARDLVRSLGEPCAGDSAAQLERQLEDFEGRLEEVRRRFEGRAPPRVPVLLASAVIGRSAASRELANLIRQAARSGLPVLITGETGTGKEIVARAIHGESARRSGPFLSVNCAALPEPLLEAELFGHERGAFSGAEGERAGLLRSAERGTFLFDEVAELPLPLQGKILRVLDRGRVRPIGGVEEVEIDVRYLFSTNQDLPALAAAGKLRQDLFYRLKAFDVRVPALRERIDDLPLLVEHFRGLARDGGDAPLFSESAMRALASYPWPGNVRELENVVTHLVLTRSGEVKAEHVAPLLGKSPAGRVFSAAILRSRSLPELADQLEREYLLQLAADRGGDMKAMASALGITLRALYVRLRRLGIRPREWSGS